MQAVKADKRGKKVHHSVAPISYNSIPPKTIEQIFIDGIV